MKDGATRVRWSAIGAAVAVALGAGGGFGIARATVTSGDRTVFVPIAPCRLFDTRSDQAVGVKNTKLAGGDTYAVQARGSSGNCNMPAGAVGVVLNVTVVSPTADGFLTVFPSDVARPLSSNLNFVAGQAPVPNAVTVGLSADGRLSVFNSSGTVDVLADAVGFYEDHNHDDRYYEGSTLRLVTADGTAAANGAALEATVAAINDASATKPYTVRLAPGIYDVSNDGMDLKPFIDLEGAGEDRSIITGQGTADSNPFDGGPFGAVRTADHTTLRHLTVRNTSGAGTTAIGVVLGAGTTVLEQATVEVVNAATASRVAGIAPSSGAPVNATLDGVEVTMDGGTAVGTISAAFGDFSQLTIRNSRLTSIAGAGIATEFGFSGQDRLEVQSTTIEITGGGVGVAETSAPTQRYSNVIVRVTGGTQATGFSGAGSGFHPIIESSRIEVSGASTANIGVSTNNGFINIRNSSVTATGTGSVALRHFDASAVFSAAYRVDESQLEATTAMSTSGGSGGTTFRLGATKVTASTITTGSSATFICVASYNGNTYAALTSGCA